MNGTPAIITRSLTRRFGELTAVDNLAIEVGQGEIFGFLGHNGAGKTTTIRLLNGVLEPSGGSIQVLGLDPMHQGPQLRRRTGVLTENPSLDERMTARENLTFYANLYDVPVDRVKPRIEELLETFELQERADEKVGGYSKGMKQRLALVRSLIHEPELIFLDEPTSGLDPIASKGVRDLIRHMSQEEGRTIFLCTHNLVEAQRLCTRVAVLEHGKLLAIGTPGELGERFGHRQRLEVEIDPATRALALEKLNQMEGIYEIAEENGVVSFGGGAHARVPEIVASLVAAGVRIHRVTPQEPSLEDVYFALHGEQTEMEAVR